jgi:Glycosyltransferase family 87
MRQRLRENALCALIATAAASTMAWLGLSGFTWSDYELEAKPALDALTHGHLLEFLQRAPVYGGSLLERAPFVLAPDLWGGGALAVYRMAAVPCLLAAVGLGVWLSAQMRARGAPLLARAVAVGVCVANPLILPALELGHPEDLLGGVLCVCAVFAAMRDRWLWAALLLGLAIANKEWALVAAGPVLLALSAYRLRALAVAVVVAAVLIVPFAAADLSGVKADVGTAVQTGAIFQPWQAWWFFGSPNHIHASQPSSSHEPLGAALDTRPGFRLAPGWIEGVAHPLIVLLALPLTLLAWRRPRRKDLPMLLLALLLALRCALDPWDAAYYPIPFILALLSWETLVSSRPPLLSLCACVLAWVLFEPLFEHVSPDLVSACFTAVALPSILAIGIRLFGSGHRRRPTLPTRMLSARSPAVGDPA